ncbi:uncharacterized protein LOC111004787 [Momordica charantia]|uniref:Uncharacterized protein LOC111004787 n=1 Tax=Momordica charantia TaxID=3673 RepID=A0A6J1BRN0_MOMCH|nr:uncharacterized protein LOC111004787 [Momordica charantia]
MQGWKRSFFSVGGKEVLIKSVGQAIPAYAMSVFRLPKGFCEEVSQMFARFWWGSSNDTKKLHWMSWERMCLPKELGGLNFRDLEGFNQALVAKQVWRVLQNPNILVSRVLKAKYFHDSLVLQATHLRNQSYFWKGFIWGRDLLIKGLRSRVGNGSTINIFSDPWIPRPYSFRPITAPFGPYDVKVADLINPNGQWDVHLISYIFCEEDRDLILSMPVSPYNSVDSWIWHFDKRGHYNVKSVINSIYIRSAMVYLQVQALGDIIGRLFGS